MDWFRNRTWCEETAARFQARLRRCRTPWTRWSALRIQGTLLILTHPAAARELLQQSIALPGAEPGWVSVSQQLLGELAWTLDHPEEAISHFRAAASCPRRSIRRFPSPEEQLATALWLGGIPAGLAHLRPPRPNLEHWSAATPAPLSPTGQPYPDPSAAAHSLLVSLDGERALDEARAELYACDPSALSALDALLIRTTAQDLFAPFWEVGRYELPALLACCAVHGDAGVEWQPGERLLDWRLHTAAGPLDPWCETWRLLDVGYPLGAITEVLRGERPRPPSGASAP